MTTNQSGIYRVFYTHNRAKELLKGQNIPVKNVERVSFTSKSGRQLNCIVVVYRCVNGQRCCTFLSCFDFLADAIVGRKERSKQYVATQNLSKGSIFNVRPIDANSSGYRVVATPTGITCCCEDYTHQLDYLKQHDYLWNKLMKKRVVCKHIFAVLSLLSFDSLREYLKAWQPNGRLATLAGKMNVMGKNYSRTMDKTLDLTPA